MQIVDATAAPSSDDVILTRERGRERQWRRYWIADDEWNKIVKATWRIYKETEREETIIFRVVNIFVDVAGRGKFSVTCGRDLGAAQFKEDIKYRAPVRNKPQERQIITINVDEYYTLFAANLFKTNELRA